MIWQSTAKNLMLKHNGQQGRCVLFVKVEKLNKGLSVANAENHLIDSMKNREEARSQQ